ncbi:unnamed protein product [Acanthoscelides obtectus]|uniref:dolichyl-phosphate-mannose--protein mannosyltransferase n=1 Tax=Acanthoscelides obtectus TaxID=200917 RepID=A0A9P0M462_ACAOB|nr:unnamed protein product [Acanthoscelides obtectus]CAK1645327.1 Transmembrane and TPR repeat-containing protein CG4341 [Acanthoscelides obtectus]
MFPNTLSFDWGMDAVPRITSLRDSRNLVSCLFYVFLVFIVKDAVRSVILTRKPVLRPAYNARDSCVVCQPSTYNHHHHHHHHQHHDLQQHTASCRTSNNNNTTQFHSSSCVCTSKDTLHHYHRHLRTVRNDQAAILSLAFLVLPFIPATNLLYYVGFVMAERVLYMPSVGLCLLLGLSSAALWNSYRRYRLVFVCAFVTVLVAFSARTVLRNLDWKSEEALYRSAIPINPPKAYGNLGSILSSQGRADEAERAFRMALDFRPNMADVHYNLSIDLNRLL